MAVRQTNNTTGVSFNFTGTSMTVSGEGQVLVIDPTNSNGVILCTGQAGASGERAIGVVPDSILYQNGDPIAVACIPGTIVDVLAGTGGFTQGYAVMTYAGGTGVNATGNSQPSVPFFGIALDTTTAGNLGRVVLLQGK